MLKTPLLFTSLLSAIIGFSQDASLYMEYPRALKVYNTTSVNLLSVARQDTGVFSRVSEQRDIRFLQPTIAFQWKTEGLRYHEAELTHFNWQRQTERTRLMNDSTGKSVQVIEGDRMTDIRIEARYEYIITFKTKVNRRITGSLGLAGSPFFEHERLTPSTADRFETAYTAGGFKTFVIPRVTWFLTEKWFLDLNTPILVTDTRLENNRAENPALPPAHRSVSTMNFNAFSQGPQVRLGVGFKL